MRLVDDRLVVRPGRRAVGAPVEVRVDDGRLGQERRRVVVVAPVRPLELVAEQRRVPVHLPVDGLRVRVEQQLVRVGPLPGARVVRAVHAVAVPLAGADVGQVAVPDEPVHLGQVDHGLPAGVVEQAELDPVRDLGEQREVGAHPVVRRAQRVWRPGPHLHPPLRSDPAVLPGTSNLTHHVPHARRRLSRLPRVSGPLLVPSRPAVSARSVVVVALALVVGFVLVRLVLATSIGGFAVAGDRFVDPALTPDRLPVTAESGGYDGQFVYRLALEPWTDQATAYGITLDNPAYRQQRIATPVLAWAVGLLPGVSTLLALLLVNVAALTVAAAFAVRLAVALGRHPLTGLVLAVPAGMPISLGRAPHRAGGVGGGAGRPLVRPAAAVGTRGGRADRGRAGPGDVPGRGRGTGGRRAVAAAGRRSRPARRPTRDGLAGAARGRRGGLAARAATGLGGAAGALRRPDQLRRPAGARGARHARRRRARPGRAHPGGDRRAGRRAGPVRLRGLGPGHPPGRGDRRRGGRLGAVRR